MAPWVMPLYIFSGIIMAIGAYLTIRYRPYCTLKSPERGIAMELHRKKLMNEPMNVEEENQHMRYQSNSKMYMYGSFILFISVPIHILIFAGNEWYQLSFLYYISLVCSVPVMISGFSYTPFCHEDLPAYYIWKRESQNYLPHINAYLKKVKSIILTKEELNLIKNDEYQTDFFLSVRFILNLGVILHLLLDVRFGLNGRLIIN
ncbi:MAG: hypothetical protein Q7U69_00465 [Sulfuricurvum sp.]|uniref:hypothetical protein n=1 Tax=Sulfuricurvum sp. TaxID=2025608 RepID=UPI00271FECF2|nr:hypothetical protein [Sulfuricurvum sp.]MDO9054999.1 hypothetical protein [Sulfuricurvum sp.]